MIRGTFLGMEVAKKGVLVARGALDTVSHNIANANTEGYSRQRVNLKESFPLTFPGYGFNLTPGTIGTGVEIQSITHIRDTFIEAQYLKEGATLGNYQVIDDGLGRIENIFNDPTDYGFNSLLTALFDAWEDVSNEPESLSSRTNLVEVTKSLTGFVNDAARKLDLEVQNINTLIETRVKEVNSLAAQIADLNKQIIQIQSGSNRQNANDLIDSRDTLIRQLSSLVNVRTELTEAPGSVAVIMQGHPIVLDDFYDQVELAGQEENGSSPTLRFVRSKVAVPLADGEIMGLEILRDEYIPRFRKEFGVLVSTLCNRVNQLHLEGYGLDGNTGRPFFADFATWKLEGLASLPTGTEEDTTLDELGMISGDFFVEGQRIVVTDEEVRPGLALTVGELLERINQATPDIRFTLDTSLGFARIVVERYNPIDANLDIDIKDGTCSFFELAGIDPSFERQLRTSAEYGGVLHEFSLSPAILSSLKAIGTAADDGTGQSGGPGDNRTALAIADLKNVKDTYLGATFNEFYQSLISILGADGEIINNNVSSQQQVMEEVKARRESVSGVSLDEEAVNLIKFQQAFAASSRALTALDEILDLIVNRLGLVGR
jgi:flagellar hook-associated protein 1 FlgK